MSEGYRSLNVYDNTGIAGDSICCVSFTSCPCDPWVGECNLHSGTKNNLFQFSIMNDAFYRSAIVACCERLYDLSTALVLPFADGIEPLGSSVVDVVPCVHYIPLLTASVGRLRDSRLIASRGSVGDFGVRRQCTPLERNSLLLAHSIQAVDRV